MFKKNFFGILAVSSLFLAILGFQNCGNFKSTTGSSSMASIESVVIPPNPSQPIPVSPNPTPVIPTSPPTSVDAIRPLEMFPDGQSLLPKVTVSYADSVPDTLDLAERAKLYLQGATQSLLPDHDYIPGGPAIFHGESTGEIIEYYKFDGSGNASVAERPICWNQFPCIESAMPQNWGKIVLAMYLARRMSNYDSNNAANTLTAQLLSTRNMLDYDVNLRLARVNSVYPALQFLEVGKQQAITPTTVVLDALVEMYQLDANNAAIRSGINELVGRHLKHLQAEINNGKHYYYYWNRLDTHLYGEQGTTRYAQAFIQGRALQSLSRWSNFSKDSSAEVLSQVLREYLLGYNNSELWSSPDPTRFPLESGQFVGQMHSYLIAVNGILESVKPLKNTDPAAYNTYLAFAKNVYDFVKRKNRTGPIGHFGEIGTTGDMIRLGLNLTEMGGSDEWEDVDAWTRNTLAETQIDDTIAAHIPNLTHSNYGWNNVGSKSKGLFLSDATHAFAIPLNRNFRYNVDGHANAMRAMFEVWKRIVVVNNNFLQINLLMNRAHRYVDVKSHIPYKGKVDIITKNLEGIQQIGVRVPDWGRGAVSLRRNGTLLVQGTATSGDYYWLNNYLVVRQPQSSVAYEIELNLPVFQQPVFTLRDQNQWWYEGVYPHVGAGEERVQVFTGTFRGNTLVDVNPRPEGIPRYQRFNYRDFQSGNATPMISVTRSPLAHE